MSGYLFRRLRNISRSTMRLLGFFLAFRPATEIDRLIIDNCCQDEDTKSDHEPDERPLEKTANPTERPQRLFKLDYLTLFDRATLPMRRTAARLPGLGLPI